MNRYLATKRNLISILLCTIIIFLSFPTKLSASTSTHPAAPSITVTSDDSSESVKGSIHSFDTMIDSWFSNDLWRLLNQHKLLFLYFMLYLLINVTPILAMALLIPYLL